jgi:Tol biopolymer transport system component
MPWFTVADASSPDRLDSWKEIALYLRRDVTTVQRWEKREGMPVHRHLHDRMGSVYAFRHELDDWSQHRRVAEVSGSPTADEPRGVPPARGDSRRTTKRWAPAVAAVVLLSAGLIGWLAWRNRQPANPLAGARFQPLTDSGGISQAAALSRDGRYVSFLSDRDGRMDVWVTQIGTGQFYNRTGDAPRELVNAAIRTNGFSPDGSMVTFWVRRTDPAGKAAIDIWAAPVLGGAPTPYLEGVAEYDWSRDATRLVYHTPADGDPTFVKRAGDAAPGRPLFTAPAKRHSHFTTWSPDGTFVYFLQGEPGRMDVWRIPAGGGSAERVTHHDSAVTYPVFLDARTLLYLATDPDGSGPHIYSEDTERRVPMRLTSGLDRYTSLSASADGSRLVATLARPSGTLWRLPIGSTIAGIDRAERISLRTGNGVSPRLGAGYLVYVSSKGTADSIWKSQGDSATEVWSAPDSRVVGGPSIAPEGRRMAFSVRHDGRVRLYVANTDGTGAREVSASFEPEGDAAWAMDGRSLIVASQADGTLRLYRVPLDGGTAIPLTRDYSVDPVWWPGANAVVYSGADVGTTFPVLSAALDGGAARPLPPITLSRGARRMVFLPGTRSLVVLKGDISHKNLWAVDVGNGQERQLTDFPPGFELSDFDVSPDGNEVVVEQVQERSEIVLIERQARTGSRP